MSRLRYTEDELNYIYEKTDGYCYYCGKKLSFQNYGIHGAKGSWHVEHKVPVSKGGTDSMNNLVPACIDCNAEKGDRTGRSYKRGWEPATIGGKIVDTLGLPEGSFGASRRKRRVR